MRPIHGLLVTLVVIGLELGCGDGNGVFTDVSGQFAGSFGPDGGHLSLTVGDSNGVVTGGGWMTVGGPVGHFVVSGTSQPNVQLTLVADHDADGTGDPGALALTLSGQVDWRGLSGQLAIPGVAATTVLLARVDTAALGTYAWTTQGRVVMNERGNGGFDLPNVFALTLPANPVDNGVGIEVEAGRPAPGEYAIGAYPGPVRAVVFHHWSTGSPEYWQSATGVLRIDVSTAYAVIGTFEFAATKPNGLDTIVVAGSFSAGCWAAHCQ